MAIEGRIGSPAWMKYEPTHASYRGALFMMRERLAYLDLSGRVFKNPLLSGCGGYSDVFAGTYIPADGYPRMVAVKELRVNLTNEKDVQRRIAKELYIWSKLDHPHILPFYGFYIESDIRLHLVAPFMSNGTIMQYLKSNPMADIVSLVKEIADGIRYLHSVEVIHSDIKPDNILVSDFGKPQLCDFGVSRILEASMTFQASTTNMVRGTLRYTSKEVILAEDGVAYCKESDVWAFGMTIYSIVTKRHPYHEIKLEPTVMLQICNGKLPSWTDEDERSPSALRTLKNICEQCWIEKPDRPSMEDVVSRLKECCASACLECLETMHTHLKFNMSNIESSFLRNSEVPRLKERVKDDSLNAIKFAGFHWMGYALQTDDFNALRGPVTGFFSSLPFLYWIEVLSLLGELNGGIAMLQNFIDRFKGGDRTILFATKLHAFISEFYEAISTSAPHLYISALSWGVPDSIKHLRKRRLLVSDDFGNAVFPVDKPEATSKLRDGLLVSFCISFSPDRSKFASGHRDGSVRFWNAVTGELIRTVKAHDVFICEVKFSPDGRRIVTASQDRTLRVWDAQTGDLMRTLRGHTRPVWAVAYSPDGRRIVSGSADKTLRVWDAQTGAAIGNPLIGHQDSVAAVSYSPDGGKIVSASHDKTLRIWDSHDNEQIGEPFGGDSDLFCCLHYSPDGRVIVSGSKDMTVRIWDAQTGRPVGHPLKGHGNSVWSTAYTLDGSKIVSGSTDNTIRIWDARIGSAIGVIPRGESRWDSERGCFLSTPTWWPYYRPGAVRAPLIRDSLIHSDAPMRIAVDGWLRTLDGGLFLWVPPKYREDICCRGPMGKIPPRLKFDWKALPLGQDWTRVKEMLGEPIDH